MYLINLIVTVVSKQRRYNYKEVWPQNKEVYKVCFSCCVYKHGETFRAMYSIAWGTLSKHLLFGLQMGGGWLFHHVKMKISFFFQQNLTFVCCCHLINIEMHNDVPEMTIWHSRILCWNIFGIFTSSYYIPILFSRDWLFRKEAKAIAMYFGTGSLTEGIHLRKIWIFVWEPKVWVSLEIGRKSFSLSKQRFYKWQLIYNIINILII